MQPFVKDRNGTVRFKSNAIVELLLYTGEHDLNSLAIGKFSQEDWEQFYQLIGYSLAGYHELSDVSDETCREATRRANSQGFDAAGCRDDGCKIHCGVERDTVPGTPTNARLKELAARSPPPSEWLEGEEEDL